ncbi:MAG: protein phosphatase 2C domain-containing protein [Saprospiraceae bacterium]|nr:protein phosphatase 2C domain-containing protein [Saprospiraceae bacterium]
MKIYHYSQIGTFHINHNEDFAVTTEIGESQILIAVMDGCSMGTESHFAAALTGKLLRKFGKEIFYKSFAERSQKSEMELLKTVLEFLFTDLKNLKNSLNLEEDELLSTLILGVVNTKNKTAEIIAIGDGLVVHNHQLIEYEQDNQPDYLGYHLHKNFEDWYLEQNQKLSLKNILDLTISTDGIFTFRPFTNDKFPIISDEKIIDLLVINQQYADVETMLKKQVFEIETKYGLKPTDDLTLIRMIRD